MTDPNIIFFCHSKDCNRDVTIEFIVSAFKHLPLTSYPLYVSSEHESLSMVRNVLTGDGVWSERLRIALKQIPDSVEHIIFFLEDMIIKNVNDELLNETIKFHVSNDNDCTKFGTHDSFSLLKTEHNIGFLSVAKQIDRPYMISHQPASIWKRSFLEMLIQDNVTPWEHELVTGEEFVNGKFGDLDSFKVYCVGEFPSVHKPVGTDYGSIIEYHHLMSRGNKIRYIGKYT